MSKPPDADLYAVPCCACRGAHDLVNCDRPEGAELLERAGLTLAAGRVWSRFLQSEAGVRALRAARSGS